MKKGLFPCSEGYWYGSIIMRKKSGKTCDNEFNFVVFVTYIRRPNSGKDDDDDDCYYKCLVYFVIF